ncbi:hypothetical protein HK405_011259, partial [Cladochytrium tenue]
MLLPTSPSGFVAAAATVAAVLLMSCAAAGPGVAATPVHRVRRSGSSDADGWAAATARAAAIVAQMTQEEKVRVMSGAGWGAGSCVGGTFAVDRLGVRSLCLQDGPTGIRAADGASAFSASLNAAATFDKDLMLERGKAIGDEFYGKGADYMLGPDLNIARDPLAGRNWEGQGADPYLTAISAGLQVRGVQSKSVVATAKHLVANEQETWRQYSSSEVDDKTLREVYLRPFQYAVQREGLGAIMNSYNLLNGTYAGQNARLLTDIVKNEWGYQGMIMSDWGAIWNGTAAAEAGLDMLMPGASWNTVSSRAWGIGLLELVQNGTIPESRITDAATRALASIFSVGLDSG